MTPGLLLFIIVVVGDVLTLLFDGWLSLSGRRTITSHVREVPVWAVPLLLWQLAGAIGLGMHLLAGE